MLIDIFDICFQMVSISAGLYITSSLLLLVYTTAFTPINISLLFKLISILKIF